VNEDQPHLLVEQEGPVAVLRLNRPKALNAITYQMLCLLDDAWNTIECEDEVLVVVVTGAGEAFCSGGDLKAMDAGDPDGTWSARFSSDPGLPFRAILRDRSISKPIIAAVEGPAVAGGMELLQATDIRIAGESATFGLPEVRRGLFPLGGSTVRLPRQLAHADAMYLLLTGDLIDANEAHRIGLVNNVVPDGGALPQALEIARMIAANAPVAVRAVKRSVRAAAGLPEDEALAVELEIGGSIHGTRDAQEGIQAFADKRKPRYRGR
jgi:enoyl-CoA hydratase